MSQKCPKHFPKGQTIKESCSVKTKAVQMTTKLLRSVDSNWTKASDWWKRSPQFEGSGFILYVKNNPQDTNNKTIQNKIAACTFLSSAGVQIWACNLKICTTYFLVDLSNWFQIVAVCPWKQNFCLLGFPGNFDPTICKNEMLTVRFLSSMGRQLVNLSVQAIYCSSVFLRLITLGIWSNLCNTSAVVGTRLFHTCLSEKGT